MKLYRISESTLKRIMSMRKLVTANSGCEHYETCSKQLEFKKMAAYIQEKVKSELTPMTAADIKSCIEDEWEIRVSTNCVTKFMKNNANLSYKKCSFWLINYNNEKARLLILLFVVDLWKILSEIEAIFIIDESSFSRLTKENYSWCRRGACEIVRNSIVSGRISLISTVVSNGWCYTAAVKGTVDSERFCEYINNLTRYIKIIHKIRSHKICFLLKNWAIHKSNKVMIVMRELNVRWAFLPPYCSKLVPVELLFGQLKKKILNSSKAEGINLNKEEDIERLLNEIRVMESRQVFKIWDHFYSECMDILKCWDSKVG